MVDDRRRLERISLREPIPARLNGKPARLMDVGLLGGRVEHHTELVKGANARLEFTWNEEPIRVECRAVRCMFQPVVSEARGELIYHTGLEFVSSDDHSALTLRELIAEEVTRTLEEQKANARGAVAAFVEDVPFLKDAGRPMKAARSPRYVCCRLASDGTWRKFVLTKPTQPTDGFTMKIGESDAEIERICQAYKEGDAEMRRMIRLCAEMSVTQDDIALPPSRFKK